MTNELNALNLETFSEDELNELGRLIDKERKNRDKNRVKDAQAEMRRVAQKYGLTPEEAMTGAQTKKKGTVAPKYRHPEDESKTWTGRGRAPKWVTEWEANGGSRDDLLIK